MPGWGTGAGYMKELFADLSLRVCTCVDLWRCYNGLQPRDSLPTHPSRQLERPSQLHELPSPPRDTPGILHWRHLCGLRCQLREQHPVQIHKLGEAG